MSVWDDVQESISQFSPPRRAAFESLITLLDEGGNLTSTVPELATQLGISVSAAGALLGTLARKHIIRVDRKDKIRLIHRNRDEAEVQESINALNERARTEERRRQEQSAEHDRWSREDEEDRRARDRAERFANAKARAAAWRAHGPHDYAAVTFAFRLALQSGLRVYEYGEAAPGRVGLVVLARNIAELSHNVDGFDLREIEAVVRLGGGQVIALILDDANATLIEICPTLTQERVLMQLVRLVRFDCSAQQQRNFHVIDPPGYDSAAAYESWLQRYQEALTAG